MSPVDTGPPEMRSPGGKPGQRKVSISEPTIDIYTSGSQTSSDILRLACAALSAEELAEWICSHTASEGGPYAAKP